MSEIFDLKLKARESPLDKIYNGDSDNENKRIPGGNTSFDSEESRNTHRSEETLSNRNHNVRSISCSQSDVGSIANGNFSEKRHPSYVFAESWVYALELTYVSIYQFCRLKKGQQLL